MDKNRKHLVVILVFYMVILFTFLALLFPSAMMVIQEKITRYMSGESIIIILTLIVSCLTTIMIMLFSIYNLNDGKKDNRTVRNIYMDEERSYLERQINEINKKLVSTDERWQEAYHLVMSSQNKQEDRTGRISTALFLKGFGVDIYNVDIQGDLVFVLTPFHDDFNKMYDIVCETCREMRLKPIRGDEEYIANDILKHIIEHVVKSRVVIAILDGRNPNVFYELGIAHALNKPTILLANTQTQVPLDLQNQFLVLYENETELRRKLKNALLNILTLT